MIRRIFSFITNACRSNASIHREFYANTYLAECS